MGRRRRHRSGKKNPLYTTLEQVICSLQHDDDGLLTQNCVNTLKRTFKSENAPVVQNRGINPANRTTHTNRHAGFSSDIDMLNTVADTQNNKPIHTEFANERVQWTALTSILADHINDINHYLSSAENGDTFYFTKQLSGIIDDKTSSKGYASVGSFLHPCTSQAYSSAIICCDKSSDIGFVINTAFPGIAYDPETETDHTTRIIVPFETRYKYMDIENKDLSDMIKQTDVYQNSDFVTKVQLCIRANPTIIYDTPTYSPEQQTNIRIRPINHRRSDGQAFFTIASPLPNDEKFICTIDEQNIYIQKLNADKHKIPFIDDNGNRVTSTDIRNIDNLAEHAPDLVKIAKAAQQYKADIRAQEQQNARQQTASTIGQPSAETPTDEFDY